MISKLFLWSKSLNSKDPKFIFTFPVKSFNAFVHPNFIVKAVQKKVLLLDWHDLGPGTKF